MASGASNTTLVASRYANALIDLAEDAGLTKQVEKDFADLAAMIAASADLRALITNPLMGGVQQRAGILGVAEKAKLQTLTASFLGVVAGNRRLALLPRMIEVFQAELGRRRGEIRASVRSAVALTPAQTDALRKELAGAMGSAVTLDVEVDASLLGGLIVTVGSRMIDDSVRRKLERLQRVMSSGSNENQTKLKEVG